MKKVLLWTITFLSCIPCLADDLRIGIIGTDSSHAVEFTRILNDAAAKDHVAGAKVVEAYQGGDTGMPLSHDRIAAFTKELRDKWSLHFVEKISDLCPNVDGILLLSVSPNLRTEEFQQAASCHKPIFVDKPFAPTLAAALEMARYAEVHKVRWFSSSSLRFGEAQRFQGTKVNGADVWGPGALGNGYALDLSWYAIHSIEILYTLMGAGVQSVSRIHTNDVDVMTSVWKDGRIGTVRVIRPDSEFGATVFHANHQAEAVHDLQTGYAPLLKQIVEFIRTGISPVSPNETLEIFAFMDAAQRSMQHGGASTSLTKASLQ